MLDRELGRVLDVDGLDSVVTLAGDAEDGQAAQDVEEKLVGQMVKERRPLVPEEVEVLARSIASRAAAVPDQFPDTADSREGHKTEARLSVWERWKDFVSRAQRLEEEAGQLASLARAADATSIAAQFKRMGKTCSICHKRFRAKKKKRTGSSADRDCDLATLQGGQ